MEKFFHTYFAGGFVGTNEIAAVLLEVTTGIDIYQDKLATGIRAISTIDELEEALVVLRASNDPLDKLIVETLAKKPIHEDTLSYFNFQLAQWEDSITKAAKDGAWTCLDLHNLAPVSPDTDVSYLVNVHDVIAWLGSIGHSPKLGDVLAEMLGASRCRNGDEGGLVSDNKPQGGHQTKAMDLYDEGRRLWNDYDPADPSTAPKKEYLVKTLQDMGATRGQADAITKILRPPDLPHGPRPSHRKK